MSFWNWFQRWENRDISGPLTPLPRTPLSSSFAATPCSRKVISLFNLHRFGLRFPLPAIPSGRDPEGPLVLANSRRKLQDSFQRVPGSVGLSGRLAGCWNGVLNFPVRFKVHPERQGWNRSRIGALGTGQDPNTHAQSPVLLSSCSCHLGLTQMTLRVEQEVSCSISLSTEDTTAGKQAISHIN